MLGAILSGQFGLATELTAVAPSVYLVAFVAVALAAAVAINVRTVVVAAESPVGVPSAVRRRTARTIFLPLRDPGADGRPRPRAPSN